MTKEVSV